MTHNVVSICPECGGILQPIDPEALTSLEVAAADDVPAPGGACQCLLCGYFEATDREAAAEPR